MSTPTQWQVKAVAIFMGILLSLGIGELSLRVAGFSYPIFFYADPITGHMHRPHAEGWYREEGEAYVTINSSGFRDREHTTAKSKGVARIVVLGDSYSDALQVPVEKTFWAVLEQELNACHAFQERQVEVINLGVSGYGTAQELLALQTWGWAYEPDIVVLAFLTGNDVFDNSKKLNASSATPRPYFIQQGNELVLDRSFSASAVYAQKTGRAWSIFQSLSDHIRLLQLLYRAKHRLQQKPDVQSAEVRKGRPALEAGLDESIYGEPTTQPWKDAWHITEQLLSAIHGEAQSKGARFVLTTLSNGIQVFPDPLERASMMKESQIMDLFYPDDRLRRFGLQNGFEVITLAPLLQQYAEAHHEYLHGFRNTLLGFGHWNEHGHHVAGQHLARHFCLQSNQPRASQ